MSVISEKHDSEKFGQFCYILLQITNNYIDGFTSIRVIREFLDMQKEYPEKYIAISYFLNYVYTKSFDSAILNLSNIINTDKESINVYKLVSYFENSYSNSQIENSFSELHENLIILRDLYPKNSKIYDGTKDLRDKYIAHIDKDRYLKPTGNAIKLEFEEINQAYNTIGNQLSKINDSVGISPDLYHFEQIGIISSTLHLIIDKIPAEIKKISTYPININDNLGE